MNRRSVPRLSLAPLAAVACLALTSCALHHETAKTSPRPSSPLQVTGSLAAVECGGAKPADLRAAPGKAPDSEAEATAEWLAEAVEPGDDDARLRAYLRCLAERGGGARSGAAAQTSP